MEIVVELLESSTACEFEPEPSVEAEFFGQSKSLPEKPDDVERDNLACEEPEVSCRCASWLN